MKPLRLRAHHGLCFLFYRGLGYDTPFVDNMTLVQKQLQANPLVSLTNSCDCVCAPCPNCHGGSCRAADEVRTLDQRVLALCGLTPNTILPWAHLRQRVIERILLPGQRRSVCGQCRWEAICAAQEQQLLQAYRSNTLQNKRQIVSI